MDKIFQKESLWRCLEYLEEYFNGSDFHVSLKVSEDEIISYSINGKNTKISFKFCLRKNDVLVFTFCDGLKITQTILSEDNFMCDFGNIFNVISESNKDFHSFVRRKKINNIKLNL